MTEDEKRPGRIPAILSSYRVWAGTVEEITWTPEDVVVKLLGHDQKDYLFRGELRKRALNGVIPARRHPEHGYWEYGPQWRVKSFETMINAHMAALLLGNKDGCS